MPMKQEHKKQATKLRELAEIADDPAFQEAVSVLENDATARGQAKQNPEAYLKSKGVKLPQGAQVTFKENP